MKQQTLVIIASLMFFSHALAQEDADSGGNDANSEINANSEIGANSKIKVPPISEPVSCAKDAMPALLLVEGVNSDPEKYKRYLEALQQSKIYEQLEGFYMTIGDPAELLEGEWPEERFTLIARFPCKERAHQFWHSDTYTNIKPLREGAGDVRAMIYQEFAVPERIEWVK